MSSIQYPASSIQHRDMLMRHDDNQLLNILREGHYFYDDVLRNEISPVVGGLSFSIRINGDAQVDQLSRWYKGFLSNDGTRSFVLKYATQKSIDRDLMDQLLKENGKYRDVVVLQTGHGLSDQEAAVYRWDFRALINLGSGEGHVLLLNDHAASVDAAVRIAASLLFPYENGLLIHGSSISFGGQSYVFLGRSGSGKSTIAELSEAIVLNDEISLIRLKEDGSVSVCGTPFYGDLKQGRNLEFPLGGLFLLKQDEVTFVEALEEFQQTMSFLKCVVSFARDLDSFDLLFDLSKRILEGKKLSLLHFEKNRKFMEVIA